ncbi:MAG TPA: selenocysteine-specific translation elongation factor [Gemmatimonadaceae bacterium]|nr:selenocysteine-specific translation elongation factor [Gemmatimonadaceae bacterium]
MIIGTAGHIDHGKTTLVRALTGVDTDRLPEEKRRGITIELGFAPLQLAGLGTVGVVDVPGHEAFVHTMLAGAGGIDVGLLVVAADDGIQPQTREHLAILNLLGVRGGVVAITKCDLAEPDWIGLVEDDVRELISGTAFDGATIVRVAPGDAAALDAVRQGLGVALKGAMQRDPAEPFRLPVDRVFTVRGTGTVVTGTTWSGTLHRDDEVRVLPADRRARVRGVQMHGTDADAAVPGARTALALGGVSVDDVHRGDVLVVGDAWVPTLVLRADVLLLSDAPRAVGPRTAVRLHLGTTEVGARVVVASGTLQPGELRAARVVVDAPVVARAGDRFVLRTPSPAVTIGGGTVTDAIASRRSRPFSHAAMPPAERVAHLLREAGGRGIQQASLGIRIVGRSADVDAAIVEAGGRVMGGLVVDAGVVSDARVKLSALLDRYHAERPLSPLAPLQEIRSDLRLPDSIGEAVIAEAQAAGLVEVSGAGIRRAGWAPNLKPAQADQLQALVARLTSAGNEPPSVAELQVEFGAEVLPLLKLAEAGGHIVQVEANRYFTTDSMNRIVNLLCAHFDAGSDITPAQVRELLGTSRKYVIPLLEYLDRVGITLRRGEGRTWRGKAAVPKS